MASCDLPVADIDAPADVSLMQLKRLLQHDPTFAQAMRLSRTTMDAARLAAEHGVRVTPEAIWRHRGRLIRDGVPTWRG